MSGIPPLLFARLRRHRGVSLLFALVLVAKLAFGALCLTDGLSARADTTPAAVTQSVDADAAADDCWHAPGGSCHCACEHSAPLPGAAVAAVATAWLVAPDPVAPHGRIPQTFPSLLRPPIA